MSDFVIVPDSSADMTKALRARFGIEYIIKGMVYFPDGTEMFADVDWETMTPEEYYNSMRGRKILYKTATPPIGEVTEKFESILKMGKDILSITISTAISGTYQLVRSVADNLMKKYPDRKIICVDSLRYSAAETLLVSLACEKKENGSTIEETAEYLNSIKNSIHQIGPLDDLFFCVKTGRITNFQAFFGTLIGVNSLADFSNKGLPAVIGKVKGKKKAIETTIKYIERTIKNPEEQIIFVAHSNREEEAKKLAEQIREIFKPKDVIINSIGMSCGSSIGPGLCAAYYLGEPISDDEVNERAVMEQILRK